MLRALNRLKQQAQIARVRFLLQRGSSGCRRVRRRTRCFLARMHWHIRRQPIGGWEPSHCRSSCGTGAEPWALEIKSIHAHPLEIRVKGESHGPTLVDPISSTPLLPSACYSRSSRRSTQVSSYGKGIHGVRTSQAAEAASLKVIWWGCVMGEYGLLRLWTSCGVTGIDDG